MEQKTAQIKKTTRMVQKVVEVEEEIEVPFFSAEEKAILDKLNEHLKLMNQFFKEREDVVEMIAVTHLARQHMVLFGPAGTGKSAVIEKYLANILNARMFKWQLTKFSHPEELFGPYSLTGLKNDSYNRVTKDKLPESVVAYLDEIFNANSSILNALNSAMNERIFEGKKIPLDSIYSATNFMPEDPVLVAFFDRFLIRMFVDYIADAVNFEELLTQADFTADPQNAITLDEFRILQNKVKDVEFNTNAVDTLVRLRETLKDEKIYPSDRRFVWCIQALKARALLSGRSKVTNEDFLVLKHIMWDDKKQIPQIEIIISKLIAPILGQIKDKLSIANELINSCKADDPKKDDGMVNIIESLTKMNKLAQEIDELIKHTDLTPKVKEIASKMRQEILNKAISLKKEKLGNIAPTGF